MAKCLKLKIDVPSILLIDEAERRIYMEYIPGKTGFMFVLIMFVFYLRLCLFFGFIFQFVGSVFYCFIVCFIQLFQS
jgi:hypothetical protein